MEQVFDDPQVKEITLHVQQPVQYYFIQCSNLFSCLKIVNSVKLGVATKRAASYVIQIYRYTQKTSQRVKNKSHATLHCLVSYFLFLLSFHARCVVMYASQGILCIHLFAHILIVYDMICHAMPCHAMVWYGMAMACPWHVISCYAMPCHVMPCHVMPCYAMPCYAMPCHAMLCHVMPCHVMPCYAMPC